MNQIKVDVDRQLGCIHPHIFGGFAEHLGRCIYGGIYDPGSPLADEDGLRTDVLDALRRLKMPVMRYPGGNFVSGYRWMDGVGPVEDRPARPELAWETIEPNYFGTNEFVQFCRKINAEPYIVVNCGDGDMREARDWVEYCNCPRGTRYADLRAGNGFPEPYGVDLWCLGNEMDGPWQLGHVPADQYAIRAQQAAKMMKDVDPSLELVACGSCNTHLPTYMEWDRTVLEYLGDMADYISLHRYVGNRTDDTPDFLAVGASIDQQIEEMDAVCRYVQAKRRSKKRAYLCFDEWNVWYKDRMGDGQGQFAPHLIEEVYNLEDALVVAEFLNSFVRHADSCKIANIAQIVNVIAPLLTRGDETLVQPTFFPFEMFSKRRQGTALRCAVQGPGYESASNGWVQTVDASAILGEGRLYVFAVNRSLDEAAPLEIALLDGAISSLESGELLSGTDPKAVNTFEQPDLVRPQALEDVRFVAGKAGVVLPPLSVAAMTFTIG